VQRLVFASGAARPLIRMETRDLFVGLRRTLVTMPRDVTTPPPLAPARAGSLKGSPSGRLSQISKKLEMPAGENAVASCIAVLSRVGLDKPEAWKRSLHGLDYRGRDRQEEWYL